MVGVAETERPSVIRLTGSEYQQCLRASDDGVGVASGRRSRWRKIGKMENHQAKRIRPVYDDDRRH